MLGADSISGVPYKRYTLIANRRDTSSSFASCGAVLARSSTLNSPLCMMVKYFDSTSGKEVYLMETRFCKADKHETTGDVSARISVSCQGLIALSLSVPVIR